MERRPCRRCSDEAHAPRERPAGVRRGDGAEDAGARRRDRRRLPHAVDHDTRVRALHAARTCTPTSTSAARSSRRSTRPTATRAATARARSPACTSPTRCRTSPGAADTLLELGGDRPGGDPSGRRGDGAGRPAGGEGRGDRQPARPLQADRRHARRLHRGDRGVPRRRLHARDARALGRPAPRADPALRRAGAPALPAE